MLQGRKQLKDLVKKVFSCRQKKFIVLFILLICFLILNLTVVSVKIQAARDEMQWGEEGPPPLLVKIAPDLSKEDLEDIAAVYISLCYVIHT